MFDTCANRRCGAPFDYRKGRLFRFSYKLRNTESAPALVHFWLCARCCKVYTLEYREKSGTAVLRLKYPPARTRQSRTPLTQAANRTEKRPRVATEAKAIAA